MQETISSSSRTSAVQSCSGYNSWPMLGTLEDRLVCVYSRGRAHSTTEENRGIYARTSSDKAASWSPEIEISNRPDCGEVPIGKGTDENGALLFWVRRQNLNATSHVLYRTEDGIRFSILAIPELNPIPVQITDIFHVPGIGLMALWFAGSYGEDAEGNSYGTLTSCDNGHSWKQNVIEQGLSLAQWPTEPSAVYLGNGRILAIARTECRDDPALNFQFQLQSEDSGKTWSRRQTNIGDVRLSTPSLLFDAEKNLICHYYYQRGKGFLKRRVNHPEEVWENPAAWSEPETVAEGSTEFLDAGNVNSVSAGGIHFLAYYSGKLPETSVLVSALPVPEK